MSTAHGSVDGISLLRVLGTGPVHGWGPVSIRWVGYVERGLGVDPEEFVQTVDSILGDERGWIRGGKVRFQRVGRAIESNTRCVLASPDTVDKLCYPLQTEGEVSCCQGIKVVLNSERWLHAVPHWDGRVKTYRQALVNHEFGHRQFQPHRWCPGMGQKHPVMQQFTYGLQGCERNSWPLDYEL